MDKPIDRAPRIPISATINGQTRALEVDPSASAVDVLRDDLDLTGTKIVCGAGVCGACTVLLDGKPATSCTLPVCAVDNAEVRTIEGVSQGGLHPIQKAFLVHDALQCGYCTPGFVVEAVAFFDEWRAKEGKTEPPRATIGYALSGHLCRCGAYLGIYDAVAAACRGDFDEDAPISYPRREGEEKVTGRARYTTDVKREGMLFAKYLVSPYAHALVERINFDKALAMDGVEAAIDILDDPHRVARYAGQPIAAVAAVDEHTASRAVAAIEVHYAPRDFVIDPYLAMVEGSPVVYPEKEKQPANASEGPIPPASWNGNIRTPMVNKLLSHHKSRAAKNLAKAREGAEDLLLVERSYRTSGQTHAVLEPHGCVAEWTDGHLTVHTGTQAVYAVMQELAEHFGIDQKNVTVHSEYIGGAFGSKLAMQIEHVTASELARKTGKPVRLVNEREEEMTFGGYRPLTQLDLCVVTNRALEPLGITCHAYGTAGVAVQSQAAPWIRMTYGGPKDLQDIDVTINAAPAKPMRGPSGPPAFWALESAMDEVAYLTGTDPVALRRRWDESDVRDGLYDWVASLPVWARRGAPASGSGRFRRGVGFAIGNWFNAFDNATKVELEASSGGLAARCATQDMGNGSRSVIAKGVAETLGITPHDVTVEVGVSSLPKGPTSGGSRTTASVYPTAIEAAEALQKKLLKVAKRGGLASPRWEPGGIRHDAGFVPLADLLAQLEEPISVTERRGGNSAFDLLGAMPTGRVGMNFFPQMTGSVAVVEVEVDVKLGRIRPTEVWCGFSVGKIVNPELARSQVYGSVVQSIGFALTEERHHDPHTGRLLSANLEDYRIPGIGDVPPIHVHFDESHFKKMKGGACGMSELCSLAPPAAIGNAVFHATGWRPVDLPLRPQRVQPHVAHLA